MLIYAAIFAILAWSFSWIVMPWLGRQEKQRKDKRRERRRQLMRMGKDLDSQDDIQDEDVG